MLSLVLLVFSFVLACLAAFPGIRFDPYRMHLGWAAFACFVAADLFGRVPLGLH
jgi:hypothetical protein